MKKMVFALFFLMAGCGFSPLYLTKGEKTTTLTAAVSVLPIENYDGYLLQNYLSDALNPDKVTIPKIYDLSVSLQAPFISEQNIQDDNFSSRDRMTLTAGYRLINNQTKKVLIDTTTSATGAYNIAVQPYATWMAQKRVKENLIKMLAERISIHVVSFIKKEANNEG